jgi:hypothetical protein
MGKFVYIEKYIMYSKQDIHPLFRNLNITNI